MADFIQVHRWTAEGVEAGIRSLNLDYVSEAWIMDEGGIQVQVEVGGRVEIQHLEASFGLLEALGIDSDDWPDLESSYGPDSTHRDIFT